jgi:cation transport ATPase
VIEIVVGLRRGDVGLDVVAALSMFAALLFAEYLAAAVVAVMYSGGQYLESFAERRASREMSALLARVPRTALRQRTAGWRRFRWRRSSRAIVSLSAKATWCRSMARSRTAPPCSTSRR